MRIRIDHATRYAYARPARFIVQMLRLTPKSCESQQVRDWRIETDVDARLRRSEDAFGNIVHSLYTERPTDDLTIRVTGEVSTVDTGGVIRGQNEKLSPSVYLRETRLTRPDAALTAFADTAGQGGALDRMHRLMGAIHQAVAFDVGATSATHSAAEAFALRRGVCQDHAQIFIACARAGGVPARYVSGHLNRTDGQHDQDAAHAWAEAWIDDLGWVGFDPANGICPTDHYVRVAIGLDALGATPIRGTSYGGGVESLTVALHVRPVQQSQQQHQSRGWS
ncbi:MAG: transglutaminase [Brevundimonas sp.]|uniref:Transglutaminase family protein n=1 Tax=Brevundimonas albigilva TaxID=1312364 RepID=A0ABY4SHK3_9CAUL|nr:MULTISPECIES: transglutaminase family protein [Brevundimonas]MCV0414081.1 transglutaminase family protein [Brevundimonas sp.]PZU59461.1 MAG: transglutaminase [Brevundimonas sp.]URI14243.1 transglutaminase family protein [Brevundimonas albigilva]